MQYQEIEQESGQLFGKALARLKLKLEALALRLIQRLDQRKLMVDLIDQGPQVRRSLDGLNLQALAQVRQPHCTEVTTAALETMGDARQRLGIVASLAQRFDALLRIIEKGIEQFGVLAFHDFLQTR
jgi:hypothetical protein